MLILFWIGFCLLQKTSEDSIVGKYREASIKKYEKEIAAFETLDQTQKDPDNAILFTGSSSIRLWKSIQDDLAPWPTLKRGFGGSKYSDLAVYAERILKPHAYRALVIFVANDITGDPQDKTPEEVVQLLDYVVQVSKRHRPEAKIFVVEVTPTEKRWATWSKIQEANRLVEDYCKKNSGMVFIPTSQAYLNSEGKPRSELFVSDKLHQNEDGYRLWASLIRKKLESELVAP